MKILVDNYLEIGEDHRVCEDYILSGTDPFPYIILSDGCSSSDMVEFGARILCHSAYKFLKSLPTDILINEKFLGSMIINNAKNVIDLLGISYESLDATLIIAFIIDNQLYVHFFGDGFYFEKNKNMNENILLQINYTSNAPYYLSYSLNKKRLETFKIEFNESCLEVNTIGVDESYKYNMLKHYSFFKNINDIEYFGICSDGLGSFSNNIEIINILKNFTSFKNHEGEFLKRRVKRSIKDNNLKHFDDLSIGVMKIERK